MTDQTAEATRLMKVTEAVVEELARQGVVEIMATRGSITSRWPGQSSRRQTATWFLLRGFPLDRLRSHGTRRDDETGIDLSG